MLHDKIIIIISTRLFSTENDPKEKQNTIFLLVCL